MMTASKDAMAVRIATVAHEIVQNNAKTENITATVDNARTNRNIKNSPNKANNTKRNTKRTDQDQDKNRTNKCIDE